MSLRIPSNRPSASSASPEPLLPFYQPHVCPRAVVGYGLEAQRLSLPPLDPSFFFVVFRSFGRRCPFLIAPVPLLHGFPPHSLTHHRTFILIILILS